MIVDKPGGMTSHDVVARVRRLAGTRRVGHAGTLDPMATGVLVIGVEKATRLLGYLTLTEKEYAATIRLGQATVPTTQKARSPAARRPGWRSRGDAAARSRAHRPDQPGPAADQRDQGGRSACLPADQGGRRARAGAAGDDHELDCSRYAATGLLDIDVAVRCSSGTYIRAIARDLGAALGTGGHLTALRRTRVGAYRVAAARTLDQLAGTFEVIPLAGAAAAFASWS